MTEYNLLNKTELIISGIECRNVDLDKVANIAAEVLKIDRKDLLVTDVLGGNLCLDVLKSGLDAHHMGRYDELLQKLSNVDGIVISDKTTVNSRGMLSWIEADPEKGREALERSKQMAEEIKKKLEKRAIVFSTGHEIADGQVMDTNSPYIQERLNSEGYSVKRGATLKDDELLIVANLREAADDLYRLVITTGGVGAEEKDRTIEGVLIADPSAVTRSIVQYELGVGRHKHKNKVRIAVGQIDDTLIVALPGPNDEVRLGIEALIEGLKSSGNKETLADRIAAVLRNRLKEKLYNHL